MSSATINLLGAGAAKISGGEKVIYIDAFSEWLSLSIPPGRPDLPQGANAPV